MLQKIIQEIKGIFKDIYKFYKGQGEVFAIKRHFQKARATGSEEFSIKRLYTKTVGYSKNKKVSVEYTANEDFQNLTIDQDWFTKGYLTKNSEFFWSIEEAHEDALSSLIKEHGKFIIQGCNNDLTRYLRHMIRLTPQERKAGVKKEDFLK